MKPEQNLFIKIIGAIIALLIIGGIAYGAYYFLKKSEAVDRLANLFTPGPLQGPTADTRAEDLEANEIISWTNYYRSEDNLARVSKNSKLTAAATAKAKDLFARQYFEHLSPTGESAADLVIAEGYNYKIVGENLALGDFKSEKELVDAWMASPGHRENILRSDYTEIGVASKLAKFEGRLTWISVQIFAEEAPQCTIPDQNLKSKIDSLKLELESINTRVSDLYSEADSLISQGNAKIKQGNQIYRETGDRSTAQGYWDEGEQLQNLGQDKISQAKSLESEYNQLKSELENLIPDYNQQVNQYNGCIS